MLLRNTLTFVSCSLCTGIWLYRAIHFVLPKVWDWNSTSVKISCETNFFSFQLKVWHWRKWLWESSSNWSETIKCRKSHCLVRSLLRRCDWTFLLRKRRRNENVNSELYGHMITDFFTPAIEEYDLENVLFQQDGAKCHITWATMALLQVTLPGRVISHRGDSTGHQDHAIWHH